MTSLLPDQLANTEVSAKVIGWTKGNVLCVLAVVEEWVSRTSSAANSTGASEVLPPHEDPTLMLQMVVNGQNNDLSAELTVLSGQYPFGPIQMLGPLEELLRSAERFVRFRPPDAARLQYLTSGITSAEENLTGSVDSAGLSGLAQSIAAQDGYGVAARLPAESETEIMLDMVSHTLRATHSCAGQGSELERSCEQINATRSAQRDIANLRPIRRYRLPIPTSISTMTIVASQRLGFFLQLVLGYTLAIMNTALQMPARLGVRSQTAAQLLLRLEQIRRAPSEFEATLHQPGVDLEERSREYMK